MEFSIRVSSQVDFICLLHSVLYCTQVPQSSTEDLVDEFVVLANASGNLAVVHTTLGKVADMPAACKYLPVLMRTQFLHHRPQLLQFAR